MIEYHTIIHSSKAPRKSCIAFEKIDGSNFRVKYTPKQGFCLYGTRTQLINETTPFWNEMVYEFKSNLEQSLLKLYKSREYSKYREIITFGEFYGDNSFAGFHKEEPHRIKIFDVLLGHKQRHLLKPREFIKEIACIVDTPRVIYQGNLNEQLIEDVRNNLYDLNEGVVCKGNETSGSFFGNVWMCKIKTNEYIERVKNKFKEEEWEKYL